MQVSVSRALKTPRALKHSIVAVSQSPGGFRELREACRCKKISEEHVLWSGVAPALKTFVNNKAVVASGPVRLWLLVAVGVAVVAAVWLLWRSGPALTGRPCHAALKKVFGNCI